MGRPEEARGIIRELGSISWVRNGVKTLQLARNFAYDFISCRLTADISIVTAAATAYSEGAFKLIQRIEILADGRNTIKSIDGVSLSQLNRFLSETINAQTTLPTAVGGNQIHNATLKIDFAMDRAINGIDTLLNAMDFSTLEMKVTWGSETDMYSANAGNVTINSATLVLTSKEVKFERGGSINKVSTNELEVNSTSDALQFRFPTGNKYRGVLIRVEADKNPTDAIVNSVEFRNGTDVFIKAGWENLQDMNKSDYGLEAVPTGYVFVDFAADGLILTQSLDTRDMTDFLVSFNVTKIAGTNKIFLIPIEVIPVQAAA